MQQPKSKSKQVMEYLYRYAIEKGTSEVIEAVVPYGKIGMILWEVGYNVYEIMSNASEEDRLAILTEIQQANPQEIERLSHELSNDPNVIYPIALSDDERKAVARGIYQTLRQMPKGKANPKQILQSINQSLFGGKNVLSIQNVNASHAQSIGSAVVKTLVNGNKLKFGERQKVQFLGSYPMINGFEIKGILGKGAYARVYLANEQLANGNLRTCALKVGELESEERFQREVQNMKLVNHPHVLSCWHMGRFQENGVDQYWISMPNMGGLTLEHLILSNSLDLETKLLILMQMVDGLEALHQKKIVHRDLKPSNCLISSDFELKISDFGLSKDLNQNFDSSQSRNAYAIGTPAYMSPDNIDGKIGYYSDVWAFGIIAFELLSGNLPWGRDINPLVLIGNIQHKDIDTRKQLAPFKLPSELIEIIDKCLKRDINQRYCDGIELKNVLYNVANKERSRLRHNRFKESWHILIEKKLIESFVLDQIKNGISIFRLEAFLSIPEIIVFPLSLDYERLGDLLDVLSIASQQIKLGDILKRQIDDIQITESKERLEREKKIEIEKIDSEMVKTIEIITSSLPSYEVAQELSRLLEVNTHKKVEIEEIYNKLNQRILIEAKISKDLLDQKILELRTRLKTEIAEELKDFDQMIADQLNHEIETEKRIKTWVNKIWRGGLVLVFMGGIWIWNGMKEEQEIKNIRKDLQFILIKKGLFMMGSEDGENDEKPIHFVEMNDFYISKTEVTVKQYKKCVDLGICSKPDDKNDYLYCNWGYGDRDDHPINCVDWHQARTFAKWIGGDLPSEAQWEYASRSSGKFNKYPWGNQDPTCNLANHCEGKTTAVCSKIAGNTEQELCDMGGNVWEWVLDEYHDSYNGAPNHDQGWCRDKNCESDNENSHVIRGGGWYGNVSALRSTDRVQDQGNHRVSTLGFRVSSHFLNN